MAIGPNDDVTVVLTMTELNQVLVLLQDAPYKTVAGIMSKVIRQINEQAQQNSEDRITNSVSMAAQ